MNSYCHDMRQAVHVDILIHYDAPPKGVMGVRCGGEGNDWQKFYYASELGPAVWKCTIPVIKPVSNSPALLASFAADNERNGGRGEGSVVASPAFVDFKPVVMFNGPPAPTSPASSSSSSSSSSPSPLSASTSALLPGYLKASFTSYDLQSYFASAESMYPPARIRKSFSQPNFNALAIPLADDSFSSLAPLSYFPSSKNNGIPNSSSDGSNGSSGSNGSDGSNSNGNASDGVRTNNTFAITNNENGTVKAENEDVNNAASLKLQPPVPSSPSTSPPPTTSLFPAPEQTSKAKKKRPPPPFHPRAAATAAHQAPSVFSVDGETDEVFAVGANYLARVDQGGTKTAIYPWFISKTGTLDVLEDVESKILNNKRRVIVYLPPSYYENPRKRFNVLLMQDGHNLFFSDLSFAGRTWKIPYTMNELCVSGIVAETIVVGVTPVDRVFEYLPSSNSQLSTGGGADKYLDFLDFELRPIVVNKFRTTGQFSIAGSSYGGIISLYAWLTRPKQYVKCGCFSASLRWQHDYMFDVARRAAENFKHTHTAEHEIYMDAGTENDQLSSTIRMAHLIESYFRPSALPPLARKPEGSGMSYAEQTLFQLTSSAGISDVVGGGDIRRVAAVSTISAVLQSGKVMVSVGEGHNHSEDSWAKRTPLAFAYLLRDPQRERAWVDQIVDDISMKIINSA